MLCNDAVKYKPDLDRVVSSNIGMQLTVKSIRFV